MTIMKTEKMNWKLSSGIVSSAISTILIAGLPGVAVYGQNATGNMSSTSTAQPGADSPSPLNNLIIEHAGGEFTSLQTDADNKTWIATGSWDLVSDPSNSTQSNSSAVQFNAT